MMPSTSGYAANRIFDRVFQALPVDLMQFGFDVQLEPHIGGAEYSNNISIKELIEKAENALEEARKDASKPVQVWTMKSPFWIQDGSFKG
jgi:GGDEF domain-containing protein